MQTSNMMKRPTATPQMASRPLERRQSSSYQNLHLLAGVTTESNSNNAEAKAAQRPSVSRMGNDQNLIVSKFNDTANPSQDNTTPRMQSPQLGSDPKTPLDYRTSSNLTTPLRILTMPELKINSMPKKTAPVIQTQESLLEIPSGVPKHLRGKSTHLQSNDELSKEKNFKNQRTMNMRQGRMLKTKHSQTQLFSQSTKLWSKKSIRPQQKPAKNLQEPDPLKNNKVKLRLDRRLGFDMKYKQEKFKMYQLPEKKPRFDTQVSLEAFSSNGSDNNAVVETDESILTSPDQDFSHAFKRVSSKLQESHGSITPPEQRIAQMMRKEAMLHFQRELRQMSSQLERRTAQIDSMLLANRLKLESRVGTALQKIEGIPQNREGMLMTPNTSLPISMRSQIPTGPVSPQQSSRWGNFLTGGHSRVKSGATQQQTLGMYLKRLQIPQAQSQNGISSLVTQKKLIRTKQASSMTDLKSPTNQIYALRPTTGLYTKPVSSRYLFVDSKVLQNLPKQTL